MEYKYLCEICDQNNNGWCKTKKMNGLKKKNIQECKLYKGKDKYTELYNLVDEMFYNINNQWEIGEDIESCIKDLRKFMYGEYK